MVAQPLTEGDQEPKAPRVVELSSNHGIELLATALEQTPVDLDKAVERFMQGGTFTEGLYSDNNLDGLLFEHHVNGVIDAFAMQHPESITTGPIPDSTSIGSIRIQRLNGANVQGIPYKRLFLSARATPVVELDNLVLVMEGESKLLTVVEAKGTRSNDKLSDAVTKATSPGEVNHKFGAIKKYVADHPEAGITGFAYVVVTTADGIATEGKGLVMQTDFQQKGHGKLVRVPILRSTLHDEVQKRIPTIHQAALTNLVLRNLPSSFRR